MRLIDADVLPNYKCQVTATIGESKGPAEMRFVFWQDIEKAPTIDAVEVVRCRECIHRDSSYCPMRHEYYCDFGDYAKKDYTEDDGYCDQGEKMDGGASDA